MQSLRSHADGCRYFRGGLWFAHRLALPQGVSVKGQPSGSTGKRKSDKEPKNDVRYKKNRVDRGYACPETDLSNWFDRRSGWVGNHTERKQDKSGAGHGQERHGQRRAKDITADNSLQRESGEPRQDQWQTPRKFSMNDGPGN